MKFSILIFTLFFATGLYAGNDEKSCNNYSITDEISDRVSQKTPFVNYDLGGYVTIRFAVDENNILHILEIETENKFLKNHVLETLDNEKIEYKCADHTKTYVLRLVYVQYS